MKMPTADKTKLLLLAITPAASAIGDANTADGNTPVILTSVISIFLILYAYILHVENTRLKNEIKKCKTRLAEYAHTGDAYEPVKPAKDQTETKYLDVKKSAEGGGMLERYTKRLYWDRLPSTIKNVSSERVELARLENKKRDLEEVIELTKKKYCQREIDEKNYTDIINENQKQIIDLEARTNKIRKEQDEQEKKLSQHTK